MSNRPRLEEVRCSCGEVFQLRRGSRMVDYIRRHGCCRCNGYDVAGNTAGRVGGYERRGLAASDR